MAATHAERERPIVAAVRDVCSFGKAYGRRGHEVISRIAPAPIGGKLSVANSGCGALMSKVLVALRSYDDVDAMRLGAKISRERGADMAVYQVRPRDSDARSDLALQRRITTVLRRTLGSIAEDIAVFVVGDSGADELAVLTSTWDADVLVTDGNIELIT
jgi:hypothetical protein